MGNSDLICVLLTIEMSVIVSTSITSQIRSVPLDPLANNVSWLAALDLLLKTCGPFNSTTTA